MFKPQPTGYHVRPPTANRTMPTHRLLAFLPCALLLTGCTPRPDYPVNLNVLLQGEPMHTTVVHGIPGRTQSMQVGTDYVLTTRLNAQPDGDVVATVALTKIAGSVPAGSVTSPPLQAGKAYDAYFVICTDPPGFLATGAPQGQIDLTRIPGRPSCMPPQRAAH